MGLAGLYFASAKLGLSFASNDIVSPVWPPAGLALAAVVVLGRRVWPAIFVGALLANWTTATPVLVAAAIATGNTLGAVAAGYMLERARLSPALRRTRDVIALVLLGAVLSTAVNATVGVSALWAAGIAAGEELGSLWRIWWLGDMTGLMLVAPLVLVASAARLRLPPGRSVAEAGLLAAAVPIVTIIALREDASLAYPVFPLIVIAALRFGQAGAVVGGITASIVALAYTASGSGTFVGGSDETEFLGAQIFVAVAAATGLLVAAMRTEREEAEVALARLADSERALAEAQELAGIGSWEWDAENGPRGWSDELYRIFGLPPGSPITHEGFLELVHPEDREKAHEVIRGAQDRAGSFAFEHRIVTPAGEVRTLHARGRTVESRGGRALKMVGTAQDMTEHRLAEERFRDLLESAPDAMVIVDEAGTIVLVNSQAVGLFGYGRDELIGRPVEILIPKAARAGHPTFRRRYLGDAHARPMGTGLDLKALRKDGTEFPVEISLSPLRTSEGLVVSSAIRDITERRAAEEKLEHLALHDSLTGLPNRVLFLDRLTHALARSRRPASSLAVFFCDIDDFKDVNDSLGHEAGDDLLAALPPRLRAALRPADTVARFGGDEFVILCEDLGSEDDAIRIAERIAEAFARPFRLEEREHHVTVSTGVVFVEAGMAEASAILRDADAAMYRAKSRGQGRFEVFDARMRARLIERIELESDLRRAIPAGELRVAYQPVFSRRFGRLVGAEALVRWEHPQRGLLEPPDFIDVADESGLIVQLGEWVAETACRQAAEWRRRLAGPVPFRVSINLSPRQVSHSNVVSMLAGVLERTGAEPDAIELEITETVLLGEGDASLTTLLELKRMGLRLVLDDFGTGYSSLSHLKRFPIDAIKIDREFVDGVASEPGDTAIVSAVISMAGALDLDVVAEGVETPRQLTWLHDHGCDLTQGFLHSPAVRAEEIPALLSTGMPVGAG